LILEAEEVSMKIFFRIVALALLGFGAGEVQGYSIGKHVADRWWQNHILRLNEGPSDRKITYELVGVQRCVGLDYVTVDGTYVYRIVLDGGIEFSGDGIAHPCKP
jgi:hypothetical protein